jgi:uncharacterized repeat protein (TIGR01451 family)/MYXO-CTERM domain-containing protein
MFMGLGKHAPRILSVGIVLLGSLSATPAFSQALTVTLGGPVDLSSTATPLPLTAISPITFGSTGDYIVRIQNAATGAAATGVTVTVPPPAITTPITGIPTAGSPSSIITVSGGTGCDTVAATGTMTCTVGSIAVGETVDVPFSVNLPVPTVLDAGGNEVIPSDPSACPTDTAGAHLGPVTATVAAATPATVAQAPSAPTTVSKYADLSATLDGPATANQGQTVTYNATVTNNGPCPSENVLVDTAVGSGLLLQSGSGACTTDDECSLGTMNPGDSLSFTKTYKVDTLRNNLSTSNNPNDLTIAADTDDPDSSNNAPGTTTQVQKGGGGGCSSAGSAAPWVMAVFALLAIALRRRWLA